MAGAFVTFILIVVMYIFFYEAFRKKPSNGGKSVASK
jgi:hypothetical protein